MSKKFLNKSKVKFSRFLPILMMILGFSIILFWMPIWIWFVTFGIVLVVVGFLI